jgi:hypothetical protein
LKYYDINFNMDYFRFVEKCKEFILWMNDWFYVRIIKLWYEFFGIYFFLSYND